MRRSVPAALLVLACASASRGPGAADPRPREDLPAAHPSLDGGSRRAHTGLAAAAVFESRRDQVLELYSAYVRALYDRDLEALRPLFDERVGGVAGHEAVPREAILAVHERIFQVIDAGGAPFSGEHGVLDVPGLKSLADYRATRTTPPAAMRPGDWLVEAAPRFARTALPANPTHGVPRVLLVRWVGDRPLIVAVHEALVRSLH